MRFVVLALALVAEASADNGHRVIDPALEKLHGQELVDYINAQPGLTFKAELNKRFSGMSFVQRKRIIAGVRPSTKHMAAQLKNHIVDNSHITAPIPDSFDSRTQWANCPSIGTIRDQSNCGSCWAFGAAEAISDRICIASGGKTVVNISVSDLLSCCGNDCGNGCSGGSPPAAWRYWVSKGLVTGSNFADKSGCMPYDFPECEHHTDGGHYGQCNALPDFDIPICKKKCQDGYGKSYTNDKYYGKSVYGITAKVSAIQKEIMTYGPVEASYDVYEDFEHYKGGVYQHTAGQYIGGHAVRVVGWGVDNGIPYWNVANSWNGDWGESGYFRILRGKNECGFEENIVAGLPKL